MLVLLFCMGLLVISQSIYINQFAVHIKDGEEGLQRVLDSTGFTYKGQIGSLEDHYLLQIPNRERRSVLSSQDHHDILSRHPDVHWYEQQVHQARYRRSVNTVNFNDLLYDKQWYLNRGKNRDLNVYPAWNKGYTGNNVVIAVLDDGLERAHPDIEPNYDPYASYDVNDNDNDPTPSYDFTNANRHGTRCAGSISAVANNGKCGVGVAYNSKIGGIRMLDGDVTDAVEATALSFNRSHIDVYSVGWGPDDDGRTLDGPQTLAKKAIKDGVKRGRQGKGSIFVWAAGNGGRQSDSCSCDGYGNSIYTITIGSVSETGHRPWYAEECSPILASTYSSGGTKEKQIVTTDLRGTCTTKHTGSSASVSLASGIIALALEANPELTWRDVQYLVILSANPAAIKDGYWFVNGIGRKISLHYGFGLMDAGAMVTLAESWTNVPEKHVCKDSVVRANSAINGLDYIGSVYTDGCYGQSHYIKSLEHVQVIISLTNVKRGTLAIFLTSPSGTRSTLLTRRPRDKNIGSFMDWPFMSAHFWGENPHGNWTLEIIEEKNSQNSGTLNSWRLVLHGINTTIIEPKLVLTTIEPTPDTKTDSVVSTSTTNTTTTSHSTKTTSCSDGSTTNHPTTTTTTTTTTTVTTITTNGKAVPTECVKP